MCHPLQVWHRYTLTRDSSLPRDRLAMLLASVTLSYRRLPVHRADCLISSCLVFLAMGIEDFCIHH